MRDRLERRHFLRMTAGAAGGVCLSGEKAACTEVDRLRFGREIPLLDSYDVVVCGGGPSGQVSLGARFKAEDCGMTTAGQSSALGL